MKINILFLFLILVFVYILYAQDQRFHLVHADKHSRKLIDGQRRRILEGDVRGYQDTLNINCDKAIFYEERDKIHFIGNVIINDGHHILYANSIFYFTKNRVADCLGNVRISGKKDSLYAQFFKYNFREKNAYGEKDVFLWDKEKNAKIWGDEAWYETNQRYSLIQGNSKLIKKDEEEDTLKILSEEMEYFGQDPKKAIARTNVRIIQGNISAKCDSAVYLVSEERVLLRKEPFAWQDENNMSGHMIDFIMDSLEVKEITIEGDSKIVSLADSIEQKYNELQGKKINIHLKNKKPDFVIARNNARSKYLIREEEENKGVNAASADSIMVFFKEGTMDSVEIMGGSEGTVYPPDYKGEIRSEHQY